MFFRLTNERYVTFILSFRFYIKQFAPLHNCHSPSASDWRNKMPSNLVLSDYHFTETGYKLVRLFQDLKEDPTRDLTPLFQEIDSLVGAMRSMAEHVDDSESKIAELQKHLEDAQQRHEYLQTRLHQAREQNEASLNDLEESCEREVKQLKGQIDLFKKEKDGMTVRLSESLQDLDDMKRDKEKLEDFLKKVMVEKEEALNLLREKISSESDGNSHSDISEDWDDEDLCDADETGNELAAQKTINHVSISLQTDEVSEAPDVGNSLDETLKELEIVKDELRNRLLNNTPESAASHTSVVSLLDELAEVNAIDPEDVEDALGNLWSYSRRGSADSWNENDQNDEKENEDQLEEISVCEGSPLISDNEDCEVETETSQKTFKSGMESILRVLRSRLSGKISWIPKMMLLVGLYIVMDVICVELLGVHIFAVQRTARKRHMAIF